MVIFAENRAVQFQRFAGQLFGLFEITHILDDLREISQGSDSVGMARPIFFGPAFNDRIKQLTCFIQPSALYVDQRQTVHGIE